MRQHRHIWLTGERRCDRDRVVAAGTASSDTLVIDAHRNRRGPYTAAGDLLRWWVPLILDTGHETAARHDIEILSIAPELGSILPASRETLTSRAIPEERTRFHSRVRTQRLAHGVCDFIRDTTGQTPVTTLVVENAEHADPTDLELLVTMVRRLPPEQLRLVVCSTARGLPDGPLHSILDDRADRVRCPVSTTPPARDLSAQAYVDSDGTSDDPAVLAAYHACDEDQRQLLHDRRADALIRIDEFSLRLGAIPYHLERGANPSGAGADALEFAADHCRALGYYHATIDAATRALAVMDEDGSSRRYTVMARLTTALAALDRADEAEPIYEQARRTSFDPHVHMGSSYATAMLYTRHHRADKRDNDMARERVHTAIAIASTISDARERTFQSVFMRNGLALVEVHAGHPDRAIELVSQGMAELDRVLAPGEHRLHRSVLRYNRGQVLAGLGRLEEALVDYSAVIDADPAWGDYYFDRANLLRRLDRFDEALRDYDTAIAMTPAFHEARYNRGDLRLATGDVAGALSDFAIVLDLEPGFTDARINRAGLRLSAGDLDGAWNDAVLGLEHDPANAHLLVVVAQVAVERGDAVDALGRFDQAVAADPSLATAWAGRALVHHARGDLTGALRDLDRASELEPGDAATRFNRAVVLRDLGRPDDARRDLEAAHLLAPDDSDVEQALAEFDGVRA